MIAYAVYVISMDGRPLVSEAFQSAETIPNEMLLAGLMTALQGVASELSQGKSGLKNIKIDNLSYHFKSFGQYQIVLVTDLSKTPENVLHRLGLQFMKDFGEELINDSLDLNTFQPFVDSINKIVREELTIDESKMIVPTKKFSSGELYQLSSSLQSTALAMIALKEGSLEEIASESEKSINDTVKNLEALQEMGLIGKKVTDDRTCYFCSF
jgi:hypothetical protein